MEAIGKARMKLLLLHAKAANACDFIKELPEGFDTVIGERGILSGGKSSGYVLQRS